MGGWRISAVGGFFATFDAIMILLIGGIDASLAGFALSLCWNLSSSSTLTRLGLPGLIELVQAFTLDTNIKPEEVLRGMV